MDHAGLRSKELIHDAKRQIESQVLDNGAGNDEIKGSRLKMLVRFFQSHSIDRSQFLRVRMNSCFQMKRLIEALAKSVIEILAQKCVDSVLLFGISYGVVLVDAGHVPRTIGQKKERYSIVVPMTYLQNS